MKKAVILLLLLAALLLTSCAGNKITVNYEENTVSDGKYTYEYTDNTTKQTRVIIIKYPNGGIFRWEDYNGEIYSQTTGQGNELYDPVVYTPGENLVEVIIGPEPAAESKPHEVNWEMIIAGIVLIGVGILYVADPDVPWHWRFGIWFKDSEPSDEAIGRIMAFGYIGIIFGVISVLIGIFL